MDREQYQQIAVGAAGLGIIAALATGRLPRWLRVTLVLGLVLIAAGAGFLAYRYNTQPTTLTVAAGSLDGDAPRLMSAIAVRMAAANSPVRLKVVTKPSALEAAKAFSSGEVDLAIVRADVGDLSAARTVMTVTHAVVMIVVPPGIAIEDMDGLRGKTVGVIAADINRSVVAAISKEYELEQAKVRFKDVGLSDLPSELKAKQIQAVLVVMPVSERYLAMLRNVFPRNAKLKLGLIPIEAAGAIATFARAYESYDLPKGTLRGSPPIPDDDLTTLRIPLYLVGKRTLSDDTVTALTKAVMEARRDLMAEHPILAQMSAPSTEKDALIPIHPGAAAYFDGDQKTIFDKYGDQFFYGSMVLGTLMSILAGIWKFMTKDAAEAQQRPSIRIRALIDQVNRANSEAELLEIERQIDEILKSELEKYASGEVEAGEASALSLATHRLEYLASQRRVTIGGRNGSPVPA